MAEETKEKSDIDFQMGPTTGLRMLLKNVTFDQIVKYTKGVAIFGLLAWAIWVFHEDHSKLGDTMQVMTYVISLPQEQRVALKLNMPDSLRHRTASSK